MPNIVLQTFITILVLLITAIAIMLGFVLIGLCELSWESYLGSILLSAGFRFTINLKYQ